MANLTVVVEMLQKERDRLKKEMTAIGAALSAFGETYSKSNQGLSRMSAAGRARIAAAQRARWAKARQNGDHKQTVSSASKVTGESKKRTMSAAARKRIAAAQKARWAKLKAAKKSA